MTTMISQDFEKGNLVKLRCAVGRSGPRTSRNGTIVDVKILATNVWSDLNLMEPDSADELVCGRVIEIIGVVHKAGHRPEIQAFWRPLD